MNGVFVDEHAFKHGVSQEDIKYVWEHFYKKQYRGAPREGEVVVVGPDKKGMPVQLVAADRDCGIIIYHAMRPPTHKVLVELGMVRRRVWRP